ncbi:MAG: glycosyltransferase [Fibrobacterota bacterium]
MNIIVIDTGALTIREICAALKRKPGVNIIKLGLPLITAGTDAGKIFDGIKKHSPAAVISVNDYGYDREGELADIINDNGICIINWYHDRPDYMPLFMDFKIKPHPLRFDFVSDRSFLDYTNDESLAAGYLPLATDPALFPLNRNTSFRHDTAFVGNSGFEFIENIFKGPLEVQLDPENGLVRDLYGRFSADCYLDIKSHLLEKNEVKDMPASARDKFIAAAEFLMSFFYRKNFMKYMAERFSERFKIYGDANWAGFLDKRLVSTVAGYYTNLASIYSGAKVNININRYQIKESFTQRFFDCKAAGAFFLTQRRPANPEIYLTSGTKKEIVEYTSAEECADLTEYYIKNSSEREKIALRGREKVLKYHTYDKRVAIILDKIKKLRGHSGR